MIAIDVIPLNSIRHAAEAAAAGLGGVMGYSIPRQPPEAVLRAHLDWLCALLAIALIFVGGLTTAVGIVAGGSAGHAASAGGALPAQLQKSNHEDGARGPLPAQLFESGYQEGTRGPLPAQLPIS